MSDDLDDLKALEAMKRYGGGFASRLAEAWMHADMQNSAKLREAFGDLLDNYRVPYRVTPGATP